MNHHHTINLSLRLNGLAIHIGFLTMYAFGCGSGAGDATPATAIKHDAAVKRDTALATGGAGGGTVAVATGGSGDTTDIVGTGGTSVIASPDAATSRDLSPDLAVDTVRIVQDVGAETSTAPMDATVEAQRDTVDGGRDGAGDVPDSPSDQAADSIADVAPDLARDLLVEATTASEAMLRRAGINAIG